MPGFSSFFEPVFFGYICTVGREGSIVSGGGGSKTGSLSGGISARSEKLLPEPAADADITGSDLIGSVIMGLDFAEVEFISPEVIAPDVIAPDVIAPDVVGLDFIGLGFIGLDNTGPDIIGSVAIRGGGCLGSLCATVDKSGAPALSDSGAFT